jgi:hypothetical protein
MTDPPASPRQVKLNKLRATPGSRQDRIADAEREVRRSMMCAACCMSCVVQCVLRIIFVIPFVNHTRLCNLLLAVTWLIYRAQVPSLLSVAGKDAVAVVRLCKKAKQHVHGTHCLNHDPSYVVAVGALPLFVLCTVSPDCFWRVSGT